MTPPADKIIVEQKMDCEDSYSFILSIFRTPDGPVHDGTNVQEQLAKYLFDGRNAGIYPGDTLRVRFVEAEPAEDTA